MTTYFTEILPLGDILFDEIFNEELFKMFSERADFFEKLDKDIALKEAIRLRIFDEMYVRHNSLIA